MSRIFATFLAIIWALWFGGNMALFMFVTALFHQNRALAIDAAPIIFLTFERYHLILAAAALLSCGTWIGFARTKLKSAVFVTLIIASLSATASAGLVTPKIMMLRREQRTGTAEFRRMHGI